MTITYLKKAIKTPQTGTDETRKIVTDMLAKIEREGEAAALAYGRNLDGYEGAAIVTAEMIEQLKVRLLVQHLMNLPKDMSLLLKWLLKKQKD